MLTRCPSCATIFRVTAEQLKAKQAMVRCGKCRQVFNALDSLLETPQPRSETPQAVIAEPEFAEAEQEAPGETLPEPVEESESIADEWETAAKPAPIIYEKEAAHSRAWQWALGAVLISLLLLLLTGQAVLQFRNELVVLFPDAKPALREMSALFGRDLSLPHKADLLSIEASDLHPDPDKHLRLSATLKNRAPFAQTYPYLELTLTDTADKPLLRKIILPQEYLPKGADVSAGFARNGEIAVNLTLDVADIAASGYRLYLFYP